MWRDCGVLRAGFANCFLSTCLQGSVSLTHVAVVEELVHVVGAVYSDQRSQLVLVQAECIVRAVAFQPDSGAYRLLLPTVL